MRNSLYTYKHENEPLKLFLLYFVYVMRGDVCMYILYLYTQLKRF